ARTPSGEWQSREGGATGGRDWPSIMLDAPGMTRMQKRAAPLTLALLLRRGWPLLMLACLYPFFVPWFWVFARGFGFKEEVGAQEYIERRLVACGPRAIPACLWGFRYYRKAREGELPRCW